MRYWLQGWLILLGLVFGSVATAGSFCDGKRLDISEHGRFLEDSGAALTVEQVQALPDSAFTALSPQTLPPQLSYSAFWLRLRLSAQAQDDCKAWLTLGDPRLADIQVHLLRGDEHQTMRAGSSHPLAEWPVRARQPTFPVEFEPGQELTLLVRIASTSTIIVEPRLWSELGLLEQRQTSYLADGMTLGITLLMVPFSFIVGWILRSRLLVVHACSVFLYAVLVTVVNGYLIYLPSLLPWSRELTWGMGMTQYCLVLLYFQVLLQVRRLPPIWSRAFQVFTLAIVACYLAMLIDYIPGRAVFEEVRRFVYLLVPATLIAGWRRRLDYSWLVYLVCGLLTLQGLARLLEYAGLPWQSADDRLSLTSTLPGLLLLACTLVMEVGRSRARERRALDDLDIQKKAEHERLESTVAMRTTQLRESLQARSLLMARISHDLRSPLVSIVNYARLLPRELSSDYPRKIERNARQQLELIDELLEFSRSELHQLEITLAPGYLHGFLREIEEEGRFLAAQQNNLFECRLDPALPSLVQADFRRLRQILINLLTNAAKFTRDGQVLFEVRHLASEAEQARLRFSVSDTGIGIPADECKQLLQPFWRGREAARFAGSGLGLSTVGELLQRMDSSLSLEPQARGSCFSFEVQFALAREEDLEISFGTSAVQVDGSDRQILLVDDVEQNREWLSDLLGGYGFDVIAATDADEVLQLLEHERCDLLITDQVMPGMDGWALLAAVRSRWPSLPVLLYSSAPPRRPPAADPALAFDAVLLKPSDGAELLTTIEKLAPGQTHIRSSSGG